MSLVGGCEGLLDARPLRRRLLVTMVRTAFLFPPIYKRGRIGQIMIKVEENLIRALRRVTTSERRVTVSERRHLKALI